MGRLKMTRFLSDDGIRFCRLSFHKPCGCVWKHHFQTFLPCYFFSPRCCLLKNFLKKNVSWPDLTNQALASRIKAVYFDYACAWYLAEQHNSALIAKVRGSRLGHLA